jgi:putative membrane protein insertion efficiency factor
MAQRLRTIPVRAVVLAIELYRHTISPLRLPCCRFVPTCSQYAVDALREYGLMRGGWLTAARLAKCGPWHPGGWDPIPEPGEWLAGDDDDGRPSATRQGESRAVV